MDIARPAYCKKCGEIYDSSDSYVCIFHTLPRHVGARRRVAEQEARKLREEARATAAREAN